MISIIITTINKPNKCLKSISKKIDKNFDLIVVGDKKSPKKFNLKNADFYSITDQKKLNFKLNDKLKYNHYSRKNLGYLIAYKNKSDYIYETDDDNLPLQSFYKKKNLKIRAYKTQNRLFINIYKYFSNQNIWPRGFPLRYLKDKVQNLSQLKKKTIDSPIQQFLANRDPDVDAIFRLIYETKDFKKSNDKFFLPKNSYCPFNSQNTVWHKSVFPLMYLPSACSFRLTDIYRSYVAQRILHECNLYLSFHPPTVNQIRNKHDLIDDFKNEIDGYLRIDQMVKGLHKLKLKPGLVNISENLIKCYKFLIKDGFVLKSELSILKAWLLDIKRINKNLN